jgi:fluoroquinolone transport system permease protein
MTRVFATFQHDLRLQWRNGLYYVTFIIALFWVMLLPYANELNLRWLLPAMVVGNLLIGTFFYIAGLVLLERDEATPQALRVTPLAFQEYLGSKILTLTLPALAETILIAGIAASWYVDLLPLIAGTTLASCLYCLVGYIAVQRAPSLNAYLIPAGGYAAFLWLPLIGQLAGWQSIWWLLHPMGGVLLLVRAAFEPVVAWEYGMAWLASSCWLVGLAWYALQRR